MPSVIHVHFSQLIGHHVTQTYTLHTLLPMPSYQCVDLNAKCHELTLMMKLLINNVT